MTVRDSEGISHSGITNSNGVVRLTGVVGGSAKVSANGYQLTNSSITVNAPSRTFTCRLAPLGVWAYYSDGSLKSYAEADYKAIGVAVSALTLIPAIDRLSHIGMEALGFGSLVCLSFCGAMPLIDKDNTKKHWTFGISGSILTQICVYFIYHECLWVWVLFPFFFLSSYIQPNGWLGKAMNGKGVLIAEIICYICLVSSNLT